MSFLKALFGGKLETPEDKKKESEERDFDVLKYDGVRAMRSGRLDYAVKCFRHALGIKDDLEIRDYLSQVLVHVNELPEAMDELRAIASAQPDNMQVFIRMANVAYMMEDYAAMTDACERAILVDGNNPQAYYCHALASKGQGNVVNAIAMLTKAIALNGDYAEAYLLRGETLFGMGDLKGAGEDADWLLEHVSENEDVLLLKARIEHSLGNYEVARDLFGKVIDLNPFSVEAYKGRGNAFLASGLKEEAASDMRKVLELNPEGAADITGEFSSEGIEAKTRQAYAANPLGLG